MANIIEKPECCTDEHLEYLDALRESGTTNMFGANWHLQTEFNLTRHEARQILGYWMRTYKRTES